MVFEIFESVSGRCIQIVPQHFSIHLARIRWPGSRNAWQCLLTLPSKPWHFTSMLLGPLSRPPRLSSKSEHGRARAGGRRQIGGPGCYSCNTLQYILGVLVLWDGCAIFVVYDIWYMHIFWIYEAVYMIYQVINFLSIYSPIKRYLSTEHMCVLICTPFHFLALRPSDLSRTKHPSTSWWSREPARLDSRSRRYGDNISSWICFLIWKVIVQVGVRPHIDD